MTHDLHTEDTLFPLPSLQALHSLGHTHQGSTQASVAQTTSYQVEWVLFLLEVRSHRQALCRSDGGCHAISLTHLL